MREGIKINIRCEYSHLGGSEILQVRYPDIEEEIYSIIEEVDCGKNKVSKEKTMNGKLLYSPPEINQAFVKAFKSRGYEHKVRDTFEVPMCNDHRYTAVKAYKEVDFVKGEVFLEVQFGKYAFMFYDMAKFQYFFNESQAEVGVEIVPCYNLQRQMSTGVSYGEQLIYDIKRLRRHFPAVPIKIILVDMENCNIQHNLL